MSPDASVLGAVKSWCDDVFTPTGAPCTSFALVSRAAAKGALFRNRFPRSSKSQYPPAGAVTLVRIAHPARLRPLRYHCRRGRANTPLRTAQSPRTWTRLLATYTPCFSMAQLEHVVQAVSHAGCDIYGGIEVLWRARVT